MASRAALASLLLGLQIAATHLAAAEPSHDDSAYAALLQRYVHEGRVDYPGLKRERTQLQHYIAQLEQVDNLALAHESRTVAMAYWINAYNALVLLAVVDHYPLQRGSLVGLAFPANSVWQIAGMFKDKRFNAHGMPVSLDDIEHKILRPQFRDYRVHMALVCGARSCPDLRGEPYSGETLSAQLDDQSRRFLANTVKGLQIEEAAGVVRVSAIFKWFGEDFAMLAGRDAEAGAREFAARYAPSATAAAQLRRGGLKLRYLDYDWSLNE